MIFTEGFDGVHFNIKNNTKNHYKHDKSKIIAVPFHYFFSELIINQLYRSTKSVSSSCGISSPRFRDD